MRNPRLLLPLAFLLIALLVAAGWWFLLGRGGDVLANPRPLVPGTAEIYAEVPSITAARAALREAGGLAGLPLGIDAVTRDLPSRLQDAFSNPAGFGLDESRPLGLAARVSARTPIMVGFIPVRDPDVLAEALGTTPGALRGDEPVDIEGAAALLRRGYLVVAREPQSVADLATAETTPLAIPAPPRGNLVSVYASPAAVAAAREFGDQAGGMLPPSARLGSTVLSVFLESIRGIQLSLTSDEQAYGLRLGLELKEGTGILEAFEGAGGTPTLARRLPAARLVAGARVNPEGMKKASARMLGLIESSLEDTEVVAMMRSGLDAISDEVALALLDWAPLGSGDARSVVVQTVPDAEAEAFLRKVAAAREVGVRSMGRIMRGAGLENATQLVEPLPPLEYAGARLEGTSITTLLGMELPPNADSSTVALFERMNRQTMVQRYGAIRAGDDWFYLTVGGTETATAIAAIDRIMTPADLPTSWARALQGLGGKLVAWVLLDPASLVAGTRGRADGMPPSVPSDDPGEPATIAARLQAQLLDIDLRVPKDAIRKLTR